MVANTASRIPAQCTQHWKAFQAHRRPIGDDQEEILGGVHCS